MADDDVGIRDPQPPEGPEKPPRCAPDREVRNAAVFEGVHLDCVESESSMSRLRTRGSNATGDATAPAKQTIVGALSARRISISPELSRAVDPISAAAASPAMVGDSIRDRRREVRSQLLQFGQDLFDASESPPSSKKSSSMPTSWTPSTLRQISEI